MFNRIKNEKGFTLIELMIVVAIIGILAAVAIPNFLKYQAKSMQSEARVLLSGVYTSEVAYFAENNSYGTWNGDFTAGGAGITNDQIGFAPAGTPRYYLGINTAVVVAAAGVPASFVTTTSANLDSDVALDRWQVTEVSRQPQNTCNDVTDLAQAGFAC